MSNKRLLYIENLRVALMGLVILQHAVRAYGTTVWWFVRDGQAPLLERFTAVNSSFFMSLFFFISFYFLPASYDRKPFLKFHGDRFLRLCVPLVAYAAIISSAMMFAYFRVYRNYPAVSFFTYYADYFLGMGQRPADWSGPAWPDVNFGHLWFVEHLVLYGIVYSIYRLLTKKREIKDGPVRKPRELFFPSTACIAFFAVLLCAVTFAIRVKYPLYAWIGLFGFLQIEPAHIAFYLSMFFIGIVAYRNDWLAQLPGKTGKLWFGIGLSSATVIALLPVDSKYFGGLNAYAFAYALFESFSCLGLIIGLLYQFWRYCNSQSALMEKVSRNSYLVYILHLPIVVLYQYLFSFAHLDPYLKFTLVLILAIPSTVCISNLARKIPFVAKYL